MPEETEQHEQELFTPLPERPGIGLMTWQLIGQYLLIFIVCFIAQLIVSEPLDTGQVQFESTGANINVQVFNAITAVIAGLLLGLLVASMFPSTKATGKWLWTFPLAFLTWACVSDYLKSGFDNMVDGYFFVAHPGVTESGIGIVFCTLPTLSSIFYAAGMFLADRWQRKRNSAAR